jgi:ornithine lipid ester-linked acyl 2-hydroxylase
MFIDPREFPIADILEANWETIREEYLALPLDVFDPWVQRSMHGAGWSVFGLIAAGQRIPGGCRQCPRTAQILAECGGIGLAGFSRMAPGTHIAPHAGWAENEYRLHLGLVVPDGCRLRVAAETRPWREGKCLIFDDTLEHEAWNDSTQVRGNLMLDFLRPGKTEFSTHVPEEVRQYAESLFRDQHS